MSEEGSFTTPSPFAVALEYSHMTNRFRPGILTAVGVMSIVIGCISGLGNLSGTFSGIMYLVMPRAMAPAPPPAATAPATAPAGGVNLSSSVVVIGPGGASVSTTTTGGATTAPVMMGNPWAGIHPVAAVLVTVTSLLGLALAIYLLVIGILTLRYSPRGAQMHWRYVIVKIPLVVAATVVTIWVNAGMVKGMAAAMPSGASVPPLSMTLIMSISTIIGACFALAYPIALIFVLRSRAVRDYYNAVRE